jgi:hypothetical protein
MMVSVSINISIPLAGLSSERLDELLKLVAELQTYTDADIAEIPPSAAPPARACERCGQPTKLGKRRFCSRSCAGKARMTRRMVEAGEESGRNCLACGEPIRRKRYENGKVEPKWNFRARRFCNHSCARRHQLAQEQTQAHAEKRAPVRLPDPRPKREQVSAPEAIDYGTCDQCGGKLGPFGCSDCIRRERWLAGQRKQAQRVKGAYEGGPR